MAKFFVGQRVRLVHATTSFGRSALGSEGRVVELDGVGLNEDTGEFVRSEVGWMLGGRVVWSLAYQLEPIQPEGMQPAKWEDCMWQPNREHANAR